LRFVRVDFRNDDRMFGIKDEDRFSHLYVIGKIGTSKSTLVETMAAAGLGARPACSPVLAQPPSRLPLFRHSDS
jgi:hypothetical protein